MSLRRASILAAVAVVSACTQSVEQGGSPEPVVIASYSSPNIPTPNDLALAAASAAAPQQMTDGPGKQFLQSLIALGGFPSDQAPTLTVPLRAMTYDAARGEYVEGDKPVVDLATVTPQTFALFKLGGGAAVRIDVEPLPAASQVAGELRVVKKADATGSRRLEPGRYVFAARGGANGVKTTTGAPLTPDAAVALTIPNLDLSSHENQPPGFPPEKLAQVLTIQNALWKPLKWNTVGGANWATAVDTEVLPAYEVVDGAFPYTEVASIATFAIAPRPAGTAVLTDSGSGQLPFPSDFLLDPTKPVPGTNNSRFFVRNIPSLGAAAPGLATLDGFSTTSLMLVPLSGPVLADTITRDNVRIYELASTGPRQLADVIAGGAPEYLTQPPNLVVTQQGVRVSTAIGLQPAVPVPTGPGTIVALPPLKQKARYLVVVTDGVRDVQNAPLTRSTLGKILFELTGPLFDSATGQSTVGGISATDARGLQALRGAVGLVATNNQIDGKNVVMAYTLTTQSVSDVSANLTALPYNAEATASTAIFTNGAVADFDPATVGLPMAAFGNVQKFVSANVGTLDVLDVATGALNPAVASWGAAELGANRKEIPALIAVPKPANVASPCGAEPPASLLKCAPLVVFHHGLNGSHYQMLAVANDLAARGFVVAAIDAPFHGDRAYCDSDDDCDGGTCHVFPENQKAPSMCTSGKLKFESARLSTTASGNYFISENFFRIRDAVRQDLLDHSALVLAVARPPQGVPQQAQNPLQAALAQAGVAVNPLDVNFAGVSLGGIIGTSLTATNPRISKAAFNVAGGTMVDVFTNAPAFRERVGTLFASLIPGFTFDKVDSTNAAFDPAIAARYAQTLIVAKWILDPAEPLNYAAETDSNALANAALVTALGPLAPASTAVYGQMIANDPVVPNPFNALLYTDGGIPFTAYSSSISPTEVHGILARPDAAGAKVRADLADFLSTGTPGAPSVGL
jgi:pimeloyl-ACP methyl ester carboxylesterase